jgi:hypothetical protein
VGDFFLPPLKKLDQGDIFTDVPLSSMLHPLRFFRVNPKSQDIKLYSPVDVGTSKTDDSPKSVYERRTVMFLSHGCEVDKIIHEHQQIKRFWLVAPVERLDKLASETQQRTRDGNQPNRFYLPAEDDFGNEEHQVDFRRITPVRVKYIYEGKRLCSLTDAARDALRSHLGVFFSGWALYLAPISCPNCQTEIDPRQFVIESPEEPDNE